MPIRDLLYAVVAAVGCASAGLAEEPKMTPKPVYLDPGQPVDKRVADLVSRMTLEEKASLMFHGAPAVERLGVPAVQGWNQCLRGVVWDRPTTMFPVAIAQAATWNPDLIHRVATAISDEARAIHNLGAKGPGPRKGLVYRAPVINISRDPRWGRIEECYGEDPFLTSSIAVAFVKGLQGDDPKYLKLVSTLKHYAVNNQEKDRTGLSAEVGERMLMEYWLPHFRACVVEGRAQSIMAAYNAVNGVPCAVNKLLLTDILRGKWGFDGYVVSDTGGVNRLVGGHHLVETYEEAAAKAVLAGCDLDDREFPEHLPKAVARGLIAERDVDRAVARVLRARFRLGELDPPEMVPYSRTPATVIDSAEHRALALETARESIALLVNKDGFLPLDRHAVKSIAVIGPHADVFIAGCRNYTGKASRSVNPLEGIRNGALAGAVVLHARGCDFREMKDQQTAIAEAAAVAAKCDVAVVFVGNNPDVETEGRDRAGIGLPGRQEELIKAVHAANPKVVVVLLNGGPVAVKWAKEHVPAIVEAWYGGEEGGQAVADVLFGDYNPAGRLPFTVYESVEQIPPMTEYDVAKGFTYMYFEGKPLFPFGHGLSYTQFRYGGLEVSPRQIAADGSVTVSLEVENTGRRDGDEVVQLYVRDPECSVKRPVKELRGLQRVHLKPGQSRKVAFSLPAERLAFYDVNGHDFVVEPGAFEVLVGSSSEDIRLRGRFDVTAGGGRPTRP